MCVWGVGCSLDPHRYSVADLGGGPHLNVCLGCWLQSGSSQVFSGRSRGGPHLNVCLGCWLQSGSSQVFSGRSKGDLT